MHEVLWCISTLKRNTPPHPTQTKWCLQEKRSWRPRLASTRLYSQTLIWRPPKWSLVWKKVWKYLSLPTVYMYQKLCPGYRIRFNLCHDTVHPGENAPHIIARTVNGDPWLLLVIVIRPKVNQNFAPKAREFFVWVIVRKSAEGARKI